MQLHERTLPWESPEMKQKAVSSKVSRLCPVSSALSAELEREAENGGGYGHPETSEGRIPVGYFLWGQGLSLAQLPEQR